MASIRGPGEGSNCVRVTTKGPEASACISIPDLHGLVKTGGSNVLPIRRPRHGRHHVRVPSIVQVEMPGCYIPDLHRLIIAGRSDALPIRRPYDGVYRIVMTTIGVEGGSHWFERSGGRDGRRLRGRARWQEYDEATEQHEK